MDTSRNNTGCSRAFIAFVLYQALQYTRKIVAADESDNPHLALPFPPKEILSWLQQAAVYTQNNPEFQESLGGGVYSPKNSRTYWKGPKQFYTWWKVLYPPLLIS
jgi:hypothetical protein